MIAIQSASYPDHLIASISGEHGSSAVPSTRRNTMIQVRKASDRGVAEHGWLSSCHTFSLADYRDPGQIGFSDSARDQ